MNVVEGEFSTLYQSYFQIDNLFSSERFVRAVYSHNAQYMDDRILYHQAEYDRDGRPFDRVMVAAFHILSNNGAILIMMFLRMKSYSIGLFNVHR